MIHIDQISISFINEMLSFALTRLDLDDDILLTKQMNEPCINHQFANYIKEYLDCYVDQGEQKIHVDCEYSKNINCIDGEKVILLTQDEADVYILGYKKIKTLERKLKKLKRNVIPDIIIHERSKVNHIIIEAKRKGNLSRKSKDFDRLKLSKYTSTSIEGLKYSWGVFIEYDDSENLNVQIQRKHEIEIYKNGIRVG